MPLARVGFDLSGLGDLDVHACSLILLRPSKTVLVLVLVLVLVFGYAVGPRHRAGMRQDWGIDARTGNSKVV